MPMVVNPIPSHSVSSHSLIFPGVLGFLKTPGDIEELLKYGVPHRNHTRSAGQSIAGGESELVGSNSLYIK
jgi:hypothetical protein